MVVDVVVLGGVVDVVEVVGLVVDVVDVTDVVDDGAGVTAK